MLPDIPKQRILNKDELDSIVYSKEDLIGSGAFGDVYRGAYQACEPSSESARWPLDSRRWPADRRTLLATTDPRVGTFHGYPVAIKVVDKKRLVSLAPKARDEELEAEARILWCVPVSVDVIGRGVSFGQCNDADSIAGVAVPCPIRES